MFKGCLERGGPFSWVIEEAPLFVSDWRGEPFRERLEGSIRPKQRFASDLLVGDVLCKCMKIEPHCTHYVHWRKTVQKWPKSSINPSIRAILTILLTVWAVFVQFFVNQDPQTLSLCQSGSANTFASSIRIREHFRTRKLGLYCFSAHEKMTLTAPFKSIGGKLVNPPSL